MGDRPEIWQLADALQMDLRAASALTAGAQLARAMFDRDLRARRFGPVADQVENGAQQELTLKKPSLRRAIKLVLKPPPDFQSLDEVAAALERRGWSPGGKTPRNTVISRLSEMTKDGILVRQNGRYALAEKEEVLAM